MFKYLIIFCILVFGLIYFGNYIDYKNQKISRKEYDRRIRLFIILLFIIIFILVWIKKR